MHYKIGKILKSKLASKLTWAQNYKSKYLTHNAKYENKWTL